MLSNLRRTVTQVLAHLEIRMQQPPPEPAPVAPPRPIPARAMADAMAGAAPALVASENGIDRSDRDSRARVGRNSPCPCGSGKKYKQCHGRLA